jgi:periplasmic divalent cation tolerance protein
MKTSEVLFEELTTIVKQMHSYEVPEVIAVPIAKGEHAYLKWLSDSLRKGE